PLGATGEIYIGGVQVARGYVNRPDLTAERFIKDPFSTVPGARMYKTGDLGRWLPDGNIEYLGRMDEQVKIRGFRIELGEIESVLLQSGLADKVVVLARQDKQGNKRLVGYVVAEGAFDAAGIITYLQAKLPDYMVPAIWVELEALPLTSNGKIDRKALPEPDVTGQLAGQYVAPRNEAEKGLADIWEKLLGIEHVGINDNFFELGGDSILTIQVVSRARRLGYELQPRDIFIHQTIGKLSHAIAERAGSLVTGEQEVLTGLSGLLPIQQLYLETEHTDVNHFNQGVLLGINKTVTESQLAKAVEQLLSYHDALRFKYAHGENGWQQEYGSHEGGLITEDLSTAPKETLRGLIGEHSNKYQRSLDIKKGELIRVVWMQTPDTEKDNRLLIVIHHLAIDGVSWRILVEDLELLLAGGADTDLGPKSSSYRQWYAALGAYGKTRRAQAQNSYWQQPVKHYTPLPSDKEYTGAIRVKDMAQYSLRLGSTQTQSLLQEVPKVYHTQINDILLAALARTLSNWSSNENVVIGLEGHGREAIAEGIDTSRTVGWFTTLYPVLIKTPTVTNGTDELIKSVKEQLWAIPEKGIGYGVLKYINKEASLQGKDPWDIIFNYLGQTDNVVRESNWFTGAGESAGAARSNELEVQEKLSVTSVVQGGELVLNWGYSNLHYERATIEQLAKDYALNLQNIIDHCIAQQQLDQTVYTPSDYGLAAEVSYQELDIFLAEPFKNKSRKDWIESIYRLSGLQQGMLFHSLYAGGEVAYMEQFGCDLVGMDMDVIGKSWEKVLKHHTILRSAFYYDAFSIPVQCVYRDIDMPLEMLDYRAKNKEDQARAAQQYREADRAKGFDFKTPPLMRLALIRLEEDRYHMLWTSHHILFDGWSMPILMEEFLTTYETIVAGKNPAKVEEDRYEDYIRYIERADKEEEETYWRNYVKGIEQSTLLPFIANTTERTKGQGEYKSEHLQIDAERTGKIKAFAQKHRLTVNTVMQGVWSCLLHNYTGSKDVVYGVIVSGRPDDLPGVEKAVGMYINTLPLRSNLQGEKGIVEWLQGLQDEQVSSRGYQYTPLQQVQEWTGIQGDLFDSLLVFENYPVSKVISEKQFGFRVENVKVHEQTNYPLTIQIGSSEEIGVSFNYNSSVLKEEYVKLIRNHFEHVLIQFTGNPQTSFNNLKIITQAEEQDLLNNFNNTETVYPVEGNIVGIFEEQATKTPAAIALVFEQEQLTYQELNERSNQLAHYLKDKGVRDEMLIPLCVERSVEMIVGILGILKAGGVYVPIDPEYPQERASFMLEDAAAFIALSSRQSGEKLNAAKGIDIIELDTEWEIIGKYPVNNLQNNFLPNHLAYVIYTSGSTGNPKGVMIEHRGAVSLVKGVDYVSLSKEDILLSTGSSSFDATTFEYWAMLLNGGKLILCKEEKLLESSLLKEEINRNGVSKMWFTSSWFNQLIETDVTIFENLKTILVGGEKLSETHIKKLKQTYPSIDLINGYGPTENTTFSLTYKITNIPLNGPIPIGRPLSNRIAYILSEKQQLVPIGVVGEICIGGAGLARGYLNRPELTKEKFIANPISKQDGSRLYRTGDLGRWLPDGNIEYLGRMDDQVKIRGYRIEPGEIESVLLQSGLVSQAVVLAKEGDNGNKYLVGYVVMSEGAFDKAAVTSWLHSRLPDYMIPAFWVEMQMLPLTSNGKVNRKALPDFDASGLTINKYVAPRYKVEKILVEIWEKLLGVERVGIYDNFFELGGHSLLAMRLVAATRKELAVELAIKDLFINPTIAALAEHLQGERTSILLPSVEVIEIRPEHIPLSFSQERLWFIDRLEGSIQYHVPVVLRLKGILNKNAINDALKNVVNRHEVLRTVMKEQEWKTWQYVMDENLWHLEFFDGSLHKEEPKALQHSIQKLINKPFDLSSDHMLRATLVTLSEEDHVLVAVMHHIASDGWSMSILVREVMEFYSAYEEERPAQLKPLQVQYADYAIWQRQYLEGEILDRKITYWKDKLRGISPLQLHTDYARPLVQSTKGAVAGFGVNAELSAQLHELSQQQGTTMFMTLLAAFQVLLYRYSGQEDICVGTPIANRGQQELEELVGFFVNTIALRTEVNGNKSFTGLLQQVKATTLEAYANQDVPFEKVVDAVVRERDMSRTPLFQVMFILQNTPDVPAFRLGEVQLSSEGYQHTTSKFEITFNITDTKTGLQCTVEYCTDLYSERTIARFISHFKELLNAIVKEPEQKIGNLSVLSKVDEQLLVEFNNTKAVYPTGKTIIDLFAEQVLKTPNEIALKYEEDQLTYQELNEGSNQMANYLKAKGVEKETLVPLCVERSMNMIIAMLGILKAGGAYVPIDPEYPQERISYMLEDTAAKILISSIASRSKLQTTTGIDIIELDTEWVAISKEDKGNLQTTINP
ncbi:MAG: amino acid adenylation domain-containing protein, partial [Ferruginibacter sp.]